MKKWLNGFTVSKTDRCSRGAYAWRILTVDFENNRVTLIRVDDPLSIWVGTSQELTEKFFRYMMGGKK